MEVTRNHNIVDNWTWNVKAVDRKRAANVPPTNDADPTPASIPNADVRFPSGTLSA